MNNTLPVVDREFKRISWNKNVLSAIRPALEMSSDYPLTMVIYKVITKL